ncbi:toll/interleukin-1 receptor domain-containing protein [Eubacterium oxidoreducens]|uniref:toll/interleukin-1 receptor domain-containing protein n=1 Tax=Eubacterium oxidoreducens TaxID=1732 RepID=UPI000B7C695A|nr:toll/interleukin-1 receptor domain-containing protein [Eubacterium oxidoreducens]
MNRKELQKISLKYRTLSGQLLKVNAQSEIYCIQQFYDFITNTPLLISYINECRITEYDFKKIFSEKGWNSVLDLPADEKELVSYGYQLLEYILDGPKELFGLCMGYTDSRKFSDNIEAFIRKSIEPFVVALRTYLEIEFIEADNDKPSTDKEIKNIFLSYCQKDTDIANYLEEKLQPVIEGKATISRDIRDVEYHESFKRFMNSIEKHDYVITLISDRYLKSRNCMYEMLEVVKDSNFSKRLVFVVISEKDRSLYKAEQDLLIEAGVYTASGQAEYSKYWTAEKHKLEREIEEIGNPVYAISQIKEVKVLEKILLDLSDFLEFIRDNKGLSISEHTEENFASMLSFMGIGD